MKASNGYSVRIIADSIGPNRKRITTWELTYPRFVHAELMTHRLFSRNSASSRAIPNKKLRSYIVKTPVLPVFWGKNQPGMQADAEIVGWRLFCAKQVWMLARWPSLFFSWILGSLLGVHKQLANRLIEPHMFITVLVTATEWDNWFRLRANPKAQPEIRWVAEEMQKQYLSNQPRRLTVGEWHMPFITGTDRAEAVTVFSKESSTLVDFLKSVSTARCARVSYMTHDGRRDYKEDVKLHNELAKNGHWSPFEHVAQALPEGVLDWSGNLMGWFQYREEIDVNFTHVGHAPISKTL